MNVDVKRTGCHTEMSRPSSCCSHTASLHTHAHPYRPRAHPLSPAWVFCASSPAVSGRRRTLPFKARPDPTPNTVNQLTDVTRQNFMPHFLFPFSVPSIVFKYPFFLFLQRRHDRSFNLTDGRTLLLKIPVEHQLLYDSAYCCDVIQSRVLRWIGEPTLLHPRLYASREKDGHVLAQVGKIGKEAKLGRHLDPGNQYRKLTSRSRSVLLSQAKGLVGQAVWLLGRVALTVHASIHWGFFGSGCLFEIQGNSLSSE